MPDPSPTPGPTRLDALTLQVLAPNASPMTLDGTNSYLLGDPSHGAWVVVDPGPDDPVHRAAIDDALDGREVAAVIITHHHLDHAEAAGWAGEWGATLRAFDPGLVPGATPLRDDEEVRVAGMALRAIHSPGHASDHLCLRMTDTDVVLTGDHVLGRGSTVVNWPDGDMAAYMASLQRLRRSPGTAIYPGHGPTVTDPAAKVEEYLAHRRQRQEQVLAAIADGARTPASIVATVYIDVPQILHPAAERSVRAVLQMLVEEGAVDPSVASAASGASGGEPSVLGSVAEDGTRADQQ